MRNLCSPLFSLPFPRSGPTRSRFDLEIAAAAFVPAGIRLLLLLVVALGGKDGIGRPSQAAFVEEVKRLAMPGRNLKAEVIRRSAVTTREIIGRRRRRTVLSLSLFRRPHMKNGKRARLKTEMLVTHNSVTQAAVNHPTHTHTRRIVATRCCLPTF